MTKEWERRIMEARIETYSDADKRHEFTEKELSYAPTLEEIQEVLYA